MAAALALDESSTSRPERLPEKDEMANSSSTASSTATAGVGGEPSDQTANVLQHLLERMECQEQTIQKLEKTVESQNDTLKDIMTTMQSGFASLLELHKSTQMEAGKSTHMEASKNALMDADTTHTRNSRNSKNKAVDATTTTAAIVSPERDHPVIATPPSDVPPSAAMAPPVSRSDQAALDRSYSVHDDDDCDEYTEDFEDEDYDYNTIMEQSCDDVSLHISQLPSPRTTYLQQRLHGKHPPKRPSRHLSSDSEVSSLGFSNNSGATFYNSSKTSDGTRSRSTQDSSSLGPKISLLGNGGTGGGGPDDNSHSDNDTVELNATDIVTKSPGGSPSKTPNGEASPLPDTPQRSSCRQSIAQNQIPIRQNSCNSHHTRGGCSPMDQDRGCSGRDRMPLPPNYIPSPSTNPNRPFRARGTSAPVLGFARKQFGGGGNGMPRLPTREDSLRNMGDSCSQDSMSRHSQDITGLDTTTAISSSSSTSAGSKGILAPAPAPATVQEDVPSEQDPVVMEEAPVAAADSEENDDAQEQPPTLNVSIHSKSTADYSEDTTQEKSTCPELLQPSQSWNKVKTRTAGPMTILGIPPRKNSFRSKIPRPFPSSSKDPYTRQGMASLNMSCVTLDSALIDEVPEEEWIGSDDEDESSEHHAMGRDNQAIVVENDY